MGVLGAAGGGVEAGVGGFFLRGLGRRLYEEEGANRLTVALDDATQGMDLVIGDIGFFSLR